MTTLRTGGNSLGVLIGGSALILIGLFWLLDTTGVLTLPWAALLPVLLLLVGLALILGARSGTHSGLIALGVVLTVALMAAPLVTLPLAGGVGDRDIEPPTVAALERQYSWLVGDQTLDLRQLDLPPSETRVVASLGTGDLVVEIPEDVAVSVSWRVGVGDSNVLGQSWSGIGVEQQFTPEDYEQAKRRLALDLSVGFGTIEVRR